MLAEAKKNKFHRLTDLFSRGREFVLGVGENAMVLWVAQLNAFERAEVQKDGSAARAKKLHLMQDEDPEMMLLARSLVELDRDKKIDALVNQHGSETYLRALDDIRTDSDWREKIEALERGDQLLNDRTDIDQEELRRLGKLNAEYMAEVNARMGQFDQDYRIELEAMSDKELDEKYREVYLQMIGSNSFMEESRISEAFYALRECESPPTVPYDHSKCDHSIRFCPNRADVRRLPDEVMQAVRTVLDEMTISARDAGNSAAPRSSSASSERQSEAEESTVSTPAET